MLAAFVLLRHAVQENKKTPADSPVDFQPCIFYEDKYKDLILPAIKLKVFVFV